MNKFFLIIQNSFFLFVVTFVFVAYQNCAPQHTSSEVATLDSIDQFNCQDKKTLSISHTKRLSTDQLKNTLKQLFPIVSKFTSVSQLMDRVSSDGGPQNFESASDFMDSSTLKSQMDLSLQISEQVFLNTTEKTSVFTACVVTAPNLTCLSKYLDGFAKKIFRRDLSAQERLEAQSLFTKSVDAVEGFKNVLAYHLQSPQFLYIWELGLENTDTKIFALTNYELASKLSFGLADIAPSDALMKAASEVDFSSIESLQKWGEILLKSPAGKKKVTLLFRYWLHLEDNISISNLPVEIASSTELSSLMSDAYSEFDQFLIYMIYNTKSRFPELLTTNVSFARGRKLASLYEHPPTSGLEDDFSFSPNRIGILHKVPFLISDTPRTKMIDRGVKIRRYLFCDTLPTPSEEVIDMRDDDPLEEGELAKMTNRQIVEHQTKEKSCMLCHSSINPTGAVFENFGPIGELRSKEKIFDTELSFLTDINVDTNSNVPSALSRDITSADSTNLIRSLAQSNTAPACFVKNVYSYMNKKIATADDQCQMDYVYKEHQLKNKSMMDVFIQSIVNLDIYRRRKE